MQPSISSNLTGISVYRLNALVNVRSGQFVVAIKRQVAIDSHIGAG